MHKSFLFGAILAFAGVVSAAGCNTGGGVAYAPSTAMPEPGVPTPPIPTATPTASPSPAST